MAPNSQILSPKQIRLNMRINYYIIKAMWNWSGKKNIDGLCPLLGVECSNDYYAIIRGELSESKRKHLSSPQIKKDLVSLAATDSKIYTGEKLLVLDSNQAKSKYNINRWTYFFGKEYAKKTDLDYQKKKQLEKKFLNELEKVFEKLEKVEGDDLEKEPCRDAIHLVRYVKGKTRAQTYLFSACAAVTCIDKKVLLKYTGCRKNGIEYQNLKQYYNLLINQCKNIKTILDYIDLKG